MSISRSNTVDLELYACNLIGTSCIKQNGIKIPHARQGYKANIVLRMLQKRLLLHCWSAGCFDLRSLLLNTRKPNTTPQLNLIVSLGMLLLGLSVMAK